MLAPAAGGDLARRRGLETLRAEEVETERTSAARVASARADGRRLEADMTPDTTSGISINRLI